MALELETQIMMEIGFGNHYNWYNGSLSCRGIRIEAVNRLSDKIQIHHDRGEEIAAPNYNLIETLKRIAEEESEYDLTKTWQAASYVIAAHMAKTSEEERAEAYRNLNEYLKSNFLPKKANTVGYDSIRYSREEHIFV